MKMAKSVTYKTLDRSFHLSDPLWMEAMNKFFIQTHSEFCEINGSNGVLIKN